MKMNNKLSLIFLLSLFMLGACDPKVEPLALKIYETSANGNQLTELKDFKKEGEAVEIKLLPTEQYQTITGFGGCFTESSAYLLNQLSESNRDKILEAYFSTIKAR